MLHDLTTELRAFVDTRIVADILGVLMLRIHPELADVVALTVAIGEQLHAALILVHEAHVNLEVTLSDGVRLPRCSIAQMPFSWG